MTTRPASLSALRTRWAAIGAAITIALGGGGLATVQAAKSTGERTVFVPITPCRLTDTRPGSTVGPKATPLGAAATYTLDGRGQHGQCQLPSDATALMLNVTAVNASAPTFLVFWPAGATRPEASSLNPAPGQGPVPNAVTVDLASNGKFSIFNKQGVVDVIVDVTGYYVDHTHDDRYTGRTQTMIFSGLGATSGVADVPRQLIGTCASVGEPNVSSGTLVLPLDLPVGTAVTAVRFALWDGNASVPYQVVVDRVVTGQGVTPVAALVTGGQSSGSVTQSLVLDDVVVADHESLVVVFGGGQAVTADQRNGLCSVELDVVLPAA